MAERRSLLPPGGQAFLGSAVFASAVTTAIFLTAFSTQLLRSLLGWPGFLSIIAGLIIAALASLWYRRTHLEWHGTLPISVVVFVGWAVLSVFWSDTTISTGMRLVYLLSFGFLGFYVAVLRDTIQIVRAVGDALRILLVVSLVLEILSGVLIDQPIRFLRIDGNIATLGPIQGVFGTRNQLGFIAVIALITFAIETATNSIPRRVGRWSLLLAAASLLLSRSPVAIGVVAVVAAATLALFGLRRVPAASRWIWQIALVTGLAVLGVIVWIARLRVIELLNAGSEFEVRYRLWRSMLSYQSQDGLQGWGWVGTWPDTPPFLWMNLATGRDNSTGLNAYLDVWFQLGLVGFFAFVALVGLALVRSWLLASDKRSIVYVWPALILVALASVSLAESSTLFESGWMLLIICAVKASRSMSWRDALPKRDPVPLEPSPK
ncbi:exopolysaccharide production protein [Orlajensenia leifsoniae]|uniref:Exopolysaccharide production protein n=1 Tax=Orlajensenia leifsoniae TaxID=2561933 RepID=A0A4Y9QWF7_9MICO|nr:exopolysaccharide production protein [Leifsonia flava]TFV96500.1 exopolysaccharide production protein [Leifsonia flava]